MHQADCPFCLKNNLLATPVLYETDDAFLTEALKSPGNYLVVPKAHAASIQDLPATWWRSVQELAPKVVKGDFNMSINIGAAAGQTVPHLHFWIILRSAADAAAGKGFARLLAESNKNNESPQD